MSKALFACFRLREPSTLAAHLERVATRLAPDNITPNPPSITVDRGTALMILNPSGALATHGTSVCLGTMLGEPDDWWQPSAGIPDGSYALFRADADRVELLADAAGSRTIWWVLTPDVFLAATSQRAIVSLLGNFRPDRTAFSWVLSSGTLGPGYSWDERFKPLGPDGRLVLNRAMWTLAVTEPRAAFAPHHLPVEEHRRRLERAVIEVFDTLRLDFTKWPLALSGGFDSRAILTLLAGRAGLRCVTWGLRSARNDDGNDAHIGQAVAARYGLPTRFFETDFSSEPVERIFDRFFAMGEGRIDHLSNYMDGFELWKGLYEEGAAGIIRGDEGFGWLPMTGRVRERMALWLLSDYANLRDHERLELPPQTLPDHLCRQRDDSAATWRDRIYHEFRLPLILAALNDLKCAYVEVVNPLLAGRILRQVRTLPDPLRTDKALFRAIIEALPRPDVPFAKRRALELSQHIVGRRPVVELMLDELGSARTQTLLSSRLVASITSGVQVLEDPSAPTSGHTRPRSWLRRLGGRMTGALRRPTLEANTLGFRAFTICRMCRLLDEDARSLRA